MIVFLLVINPKTSIMLVFTCHYKKNLKNITFVIILIFVYVYAIIGTNNFSDDFPLYFGNLGRSLLTLCQITTFDSWISNVARPIITVYTWAWLYFISYALITASIIMNVIVGIIVDYMNDTRKESDRAKNKNHNSATLEDVLYEIEILNEKLDAIVAEKNIL